MPAKICALDKDVFTRGAMEINTSLRPVGGHDPYNPFRVGVEYTITQGRFGGPNQPWAERFVPRWGTVKAGVKGLGEVFRVGFVCLNGLSAGES